MLDTHQSEFLAERHFGRHLVQMCMLFGRKFRGRISLASIEQRSNSTERSTEMSPAEISLAEISLAKISLAKMSPAEMSLVEMFPAKMSLAEISLAEMSPAEMSTAKMGADPIGLNLLWCVSTIA